MKNWLKTLSISRLTILFIGIVSVVLIFSAILKEKGNYKVIASDGVGYYSYLPNTFLSNTLDSQIPDSRFFVEVNRKGVNKYYVGTAVSMSPFFTIGHFMALARGEEKDVFALSYQLAISLAGFVYLLGGLFFLERLLRQFNFSETVISCVLLLIFFGTNLIEYSLWQPSMSHVYSFFWISGFLYFCKKFFNERKNKQLYLAGFFLALVVLVRPLNGIIVFALPFLLGSKRDLQQFLIAVFKKKRVFPSLIIVISVLFIQSLFWQLQSGDWLIWSYTNEGFEFANPHILEFLFSFRKGAFIYTPILILAIFGIVARFKKNKFQSLSGLLFIFGLFYLLSSWWNWYYGPSFGQRPLVEFYPIFGVFIALLLEKIKQNWMKIFVAIFALFCVILNLIQTYQYNNNIISHWDMNAEKYAYTFLKTSKNYKDILGGNNDIMVYNAKLDTVFSEFFDFEPLDDLNNSENFRLQKMEIGFRDYTNREFNFETKIPTNKSFVTQRGIYILADLKVLDKNILNQNEALFVVDISDSLGNNYEYRTFPIRNTPPTETDSWKPNSYRIEIKEIRSAKDKIKLYIWNKGMEEFWVDDIEIKIATVE